MDPSLRDYAKRRDAERRAERRALGPALAASALLHVAVLLVFTFDLDPQPYATTAPPQRLLNIEPSMRAYDIATVAVEPAPIEVQLEARRRVTDQLPVTAPRPVAPPAAADDRAPAPTARDLSARERLQYRMGSAEVWRPQAPMPVEALSPDEIVRRRIAGQIGEYNDSVAGEAAARARATDWTVKGEDGQRWGVSPGQVHLGSVTLPLPFELRPSQEVAGRVRSWTEIQQQAARVEGREIFNDRVRAIRERTERERTRQNATTEPPPGTTDATGGG